MDTLTIPTQAEAGGALGTHADASSAPGAACGGALPSAGFHYGVTFEQYQSWDAVNVSKLKPFRRTPFHARWEMDHPRESEAMDVGSALHTAILEPGKFAERFLIAPLYDARKKEGREIAAQCEAEAAGRTVIRRKASPGEVGGDDIEGMASTVRQFKAPSKLLDLPGQCEVSALWKDETTGLMCKCRFDKLVTRPPVILEIKTCRDASNWAFGGQCAKLGYAAQASYYRWAHKVLTGVEATHVFLAIENKGPWAPKCWTLDDASLQTGALAFRAWLNQYAECVKSGTWPGYHDSVEVLSLPVWANRETYED